MKTGLIIPSEFEMNLLDKTLLIEFPVYRLSGMGKVKAAFATAELIQVLKCQKIVLFGFAGGLKGLRSGDIIEPSIVFEGDFDTSAISKISRPEDHNKIDLSTNHLLSESLACPIVTQDKFLIENIYGFDYSMLATDMETYAVAYVCQETNAKFQCVRIISDTIHNTNFRSNIKNLKVLLNAALDRILSELKHD